MMKTEITQIESLERVAVMNDEERVAVVERQQAHRNSAGSLRSTPGTQHCDDL